MNTSHLVVLLLGLVIGAMTTWLVVRAWQAKNTADEAGALARQQAELQRAFAEVERARSETAQVRVEAAEVRTRLAESGSRDAELRAQISEAHTDRAEANTEKERVQALLAGAEAQRDSALSQLKELLAGGDRMKDAFALLSTQALDQQGVKADAVAQERLKATQQVIEPIAVLLKDLSTRITEVEKERATIAADLKAQVMQVTRTGEELRRETSSLSTALRKPHLRGAWGETQLKRVAESAGMLEHCDFETQTTTVNTDDNTIRPDMKVHFGGGKFVWVDSKVPLTAFLDAQAAEDDKSSQAHLKTFARHVRTHIDQLSGKHYWTSDAGSPEFVLLFMPSDTLFAEALAQMPDLHDYASNHNVVLTSPSSLIATLRTIGYSWRQAKLAESAAEVFQLGRELHTRLATMGSHFDKVGRQLGSSVKAYNEAIGSLEGRVFATARKFTELKVTNDDLAPLNEIPIAPRQLTAPELIEQADEVPALAGRERHAGDGLLHRGEPSTDDLVESTQPRLLEIKRRELS